MRFYIVLFIIYIVDKIDFLLLRVRSRARFFYYFFNFLDFSLTLYGLVKQLYSDQVASLAVELNVILLTL